MKVIKSIKIIFLLALLFAIPQIVYSEDISNLYTIKNITDGSQLDFHPEFSPDGKKIVFMTKTDVSERMKKGEFWHRSSFYLNLWIMDIDGKNRRQLTLGEYYDFAPKFSSDGKKVLFVSNRREGKWDIWSINNDGSNLIEITENDYREHYPRPSPDGKEIVYITYKGPHGSVWLMDNEGKNSRRVTSGGFGDDFPVMSPDGKDIAFKSTRLGNGDIWTIDKLGKKYNRLTYEEYPEFYPAWSPDGSKISYVTNKGGVFDVWVMNRDGSNKKKLTSNISKGEWGEKFDYSNHLESGYYHVSWHPDGDKIALTTWEPGSKKGNYISVLKFDNEIVDIMNKQPVDGGPVKEYTLIGEREITKGNWEDFAPCFSPDGKSIIFASNRKGNWDLWSIGIDIENLKQITKETVDEIAPVFSPDGKEIAFLKGSGKTEDRSQYSLWTMKSDGSSLKQLTKNISVLSYPGWSPDGKDISFVSNGTEGTEIWTYNLKSSKSRKIVSAWDIKMSKPPVSPFSHGEKKLSESEKVKLRELFPNLKPGMGGLTPFTHIESMMIDYPLNELLYRVDYNKGGDRITFESNRSGNVDIWTVKKDGSDLKQVTREDGPHWSPVYSPDGNKIAYAREKFSASSFNEANYNIWIADAKTGEEMMITGEEQTDWNPVWSPDGKKMAYVTNRSGEFKHFSIWMLYLK